MNVYFRIAPHYARLRYTPRGVNPRPLPYESYYTQHDLLDHAEQHDWHCMAYATFLLNLYHNGEL